MHPKIFNYKQSLRDFKLNEHGSQPPLCSCSSSTYLYSPAGHVVTGNLNIVENLKLRNILSKGPKYREPTTFSWKYNFKLVMDSVEDYARRWAKEEEVELDSLSEWIKSIRHLLNCRMYMAGRSINNKPKSVFSDTDVTEHLADLHKRYVIVPADKASNNVVFVCKTYYFECLQRELELDDSIFNLLISGLLFRKTKF